MTSWGKEGLQKPLGVFKGSTTYTVTEPKPVGTNQKEWFFTPVHLLRLLVWLLPSLFGLSMLRRAYAKVVGNAATRVVCSPFSAGFGGTEFSLNLSLNFPNFGLT